MRKVETTEQAVHRLVKRCGQAVDKLYDGLADKAAGYDDMREIVNAVEELAQIALWQSGLRKEYEKEYL